MQPKLVEQVRVRLSQQADKTVAADLTWTEIETLLGQIDRLEHERTSALDEMTESNQDVGC